MDWTTCIVLCTLIIACAMSAISFSVRSVKELKRHIEFLENHVERHSNCRKNAENHIIELYKRRK